MIGERIESVPPERRMSRIEMEHGFPRRIENPPERSGAVDSRRLEKARDPKRRRGKVEPESFAAIADRAQAVPPAVAVARKSFVQPHAESTGTQCLKRNSPLRTTTENFRRDPPVVRIAPRKYRERESDTGQVDFETIRNRAAADMADAADPARVDSESARRVVETFSHARPRFVEQSEFRPPEERYAARSDDEVRVGKVEQLIQESRRHDIENRRRLFDELRLRWHAGNLVRSSRFACACLSVCGDRLRFRNASPRRDKATRVEGHGSSMVFHGLFQLRLPSESEMQHSSRSPSLPAATRAKSPPGPCRETRGSFEIDFSEMPT